MYDLTFCILHVQRPMKLKQCVNSIRKNTNIPYKIIILQQGLQNNETKKYLSKLQNRRNIDILYSDYNLGCGGGRKVLVDKADTQFIMTLDDDIYVQKNWFKPVISLFNNHDMEAVGIPQYTNNHRLFNMSGKWIKIPLRKKIVRYKNIPLKLIKSEKDFIQVNSVSGGVMIFREELRSKFTWDGRYSTGFDDLDKSLQIITKGQTDQAISLKSKAIHDQEYSGIKYLETRWNGLEIANSYKTFIEKWGLRLPLKNHITYIHLYPKIMPILIERGLFEFTRKLRRTKTMIKGI